MKVAVRVLLAALLVVSVAGAVWAHGYRPMLTVQVPARTVCTGIPDNLGGCEFGKTITYPARTERSAGVRPQWADPLAAGLLTVALLAGGTLLVGFRVRRDATPS